MKKIGLLLLGAVSLTALNVCSDIEGGFVDSAPAAPTYQFEPTSRAVLEPLQIETSRDPKVVLRAAGRLFLLGVYTEDRLSRLGLFSSRNSGDAFAPPVTVSEPGANVSSHGENSPSLVFGRGREAFVLWEQAGGQGGDTELMFARSLDLGHYFDKPIRITDKESPSQNGFSSLSVAPNGDLYVAWLDGRDSSDVVTGTASAYLAKSTDMGKSFGKNIRLSAACPCCRPPVAFGNDGEVFVSWRHVFEGNIRDMVVTTSRDGGETFSAPVRVAEDNWEIQGCPHSGSSLLQAGDRLYISWFTAGKNAEPGIQLSWSDDGGASFVPPVNVSSGIVYANHPVLSEAWDGRVLLVFQGRALSDEDEWGHVTAYLVEVSAEGEVSEPQAVPGNGVSISYPMVAGDIQEGVFLAWSEPTKSGPQIVLSRGHKSLQPAN